MIQAFIHVDVPVRAKRQRPRAAPQRAAVLELLRPLRGLVHRFQQFFARERLR
jgi:hypothetical protein